MSRKPWGEPSSTMELVFRNSASPRLLSKQASERTEDSARHSENSSSSTQPASWLCAGCRYTEHYETAERNGRSHTASCDDSDDEEHWLCSGQGEAFRKLRSDAARREDACTPADETVHNIGLATDCFSLVLVAEELCSPTKLLLLPIVCASAQVTVLLFMATFNEYEFMEGVWLSPRCNRGSLMAMRFIALVLSVLKTSGELATTLALFQAIISCRPPLQHLGRRKRSIRWAAWVALVTQYMMAMCMLVTCAHIALAETNPMFSLIKVLAAWLVIDIDNMLAVYVVEVFDWRHLQWSVQVSTPMQAEILPCTDWDTFRQLTPRSSWKLWVPSRVVLERGQVLLKRTKCARFIFFGVPVLTIFAEVGLALWFDVLPFTYLSRGLVSNVDPPLLLSSNVGLPAGCCPPTAHELKAGLGWNVSVMFLLPARDISVALAQRPPQISWVLTESMAIAPSSLQVVDGFTGKSLRAHHYGSMVADRTQAYFWLLANGYDGRDAENIYQMLLNSPGLQLYKTHIPYSAHFTMSLPERSSQASYKIFVSARNMQSLALAPEPVASAVLQVAAIGCPSGCTDCRQGHCFKCAEGRHLNPVEKACIECAPHCKYCDVAGDSRCDNHACSPGYGRTSDGLCAACNVTGCSSCDRRFPVRVTSRDLVERTEDAVEQLVHHSTGNQLAQAFPGICDVCEPGRGLSRDRLRCDPCGQHCKSCTFSAVSPLASSEFSNASRRPTNGSSAVSPLASSEFSNASRRPTNGSSAVSPLALSEFSNASRRPTNGSSAAVASNCSVCESGYGFVREISLMKAVHTCTSCPEHCTDCSEANHCDRCAPGFAWHAATRRCAECADGCSNCTKAGPGRCDSDGCRNGHGYKQGKEVCQPCQIQNCVSCTFIRASSGLEVPLEERCSNCSVGYGTTEEGKCEHCGQFCSQCDHAGACSVCQQHFMLDNASRRAGAGKCQACGDRCMSCNVAGPGHCDACMSGFDVDSATRTCLPKKSRDPYQEM